ncbi:MAG: 5-dehydro-4-deoxy-D-glucuronate isomerase [Sediminibacterium sp.]|nr:5-dehydro-4-deoxy-D-glucuronate isomerase [Sediminibacterium sp.]
MNIKYTQSPAETAKMNANQLSESFLVNNLFQKNEIVLTYSHYDRMIIGGIMPTLEKIKLPNPTSLKATYFLERREMGILNIGGKGTIYCDNQVFELNTFDCLYIGKGTKEIFFKSDIENNLSNFYLLSAPAHHSYPITKISKENAQPLDLGDDENANKRTVYKYIHEDGIKSCQLVMGLTMLKKGSVWNSIPPHIHDRRMEVYFYFNVQMDQCIFHFMGESQETKHIIVKNNEAVISPPWSTHFGCGTCNYNFIWGMAGENLDYTDMDKLSLTALK